jgi:hypothetical protein
MSPRLRQRTPGPAVVVLFALLISAAIAVAAVATAHAGQFKMVACASNSGVGYTVETNTANAQHPSGIFDFNNYCGGAGGDPPGEYAFVRIVEHEPSGNAGEGAYGRMVFETPWYVHFKAAGGYTRQPNAFNDGWRARFWGLDFSSNGTIFLNQGAGLPNSGAQSPSSNTFGPHLWPFGSYLDFHHFFFELYCQRPGGCDRSNYNATDANAFVFILNDDSDSKVAIDNVADPMMQGQWVRGPQGVFWKSSDLGSGMRFERVRVDGGERFAYDNQARGMCNATSSQSSGEFSRVYQPCPTGGPWASSWTLDTASLSDGQHTLSVCTQDYGQYRGLNGTGGETCDARTIRVDNTPPGAPAGLQVTSANSARYLDHFGTHWTLPPNAGSPIAKVHYNVVNANGDVVVPEQTVSGSNISQLNSIAGPSQPGDYRMRVWLEDSVGLVSPAAIAPIPHDTVPPAAPQDVSVTSPTTSRAAQGFDLRWHNIVDNGSPIDRVHYQVINRAGGVVVPDQTVGGENVQAIGDLETPRERGGYSLRLWLEDAEGNVGAPTSAPLAYECMRSDVGGGSNLTSGLGAKRTAEEIVQQGTGTILRGKLTGAGGAGISDAPLCVFSRVVTNQSREFLGVAVSGADGSYQFAIPAGASRDLDVLYRSGSRELTGRASVQTVVHPTFGVYRKVVYNKRSAHFTGAIPGPDNNQVVVVLQVKRGKGWLAFHRYRTREGGKFTVGYKFNKTNVATKYLMRVQVRSQSGYPYLQGNSDPLTLIVLPRAPRHVVNGNPPPVGRVNKESESTASAWAGSVEVAGHTHSVRR